MRKVSVFLVFLVVSMAFWALLAATSHHVFAAVTIRPAQSSFKWTHDLSGSMRDMDEGTISHVYVQNPVLSYFEVGLISIGAAIVVVGALLSFGRRSKIKIPLAKATIVRVEKSAVASVAQNVQGSPTLYPFVLKALTDEERKVVNVLVSRDGKCLQKDIREITGLGGQTIRIVARLTERGILTFEHSGNMQEVHLASWLKKEVPV